MRNVIVTGGSRGLGLAIAQRLARSGYRSIAIARNHNSNLAAAIEEANSAAHGSFYFERCDLADIESTPEIVKCIRQKFGPIYGLVNNAGISFDGPLAIMSADKIDQMVRINTLSPLIMTKSVIRWMMADGGGRIVNIASITAFTGYSGLAVYGATKASIVGLTRSLAREVGRLGINVNAVAPGFVETNMTQGLSEDQLEKIRRRSALKRFPDTDDIASTVEFLFSDGAKNITGSVITVDAGNSA